MEHKKYRDIERLKENNSDTFKPGDHIIITEKIDGCFNYDAKVTLEDGAKIKIGDIVKDQLDVRVLSYNEETNIVEPKSVVNWFDNGGKEFIKVKIQRPTGQGGAPTEITCTKNHLFYTNDGWKAAEDLIAGDLVCTNLEKMNFVQSQMILGGLLGDSSIYPSSSTAHTRNRGFVFSHCEKQLDYLNFKKRVFGTFIKSVDTYISGYNSNMIRVKSRCCDETNKIIRICMNNDCKKTVNKEWINKLTPLALAIWYMDDGSLKHNAMQSDRACLHTEGYTYEENLMFSDMLLQKYGIKNTLIFYKDKYYRIDMNKEGSDIFFTLVSPFIIRSMQYKLPEEYRNGFNYFEDIYLKRKNPNCLNTSKVVCVEKDNPIIVSHSYDLEIEDNHNYFVNDFLVHNCNSAICYDSETNSIVAQSRKKILDETENLRGFYQYVQTLDADKVKELLGSRYLLCGEWAVPHTVVYPKESQDKMYVFDLYDTETKTYLDMHQAFLVADTLGLPKVAVFYEGEFISWEHCMSFVGKTALGGEYGEGIVIHGDDGKIIKIVSDRFAETKKIKKIPTPEELAAQSQAYELAKTIVTEARVRKILNKLVDENILPEKWDEHDLKTVSQHLPKRVYEDCMKEEPETANLIKKDFGKLAGKISMTYARSFIM